MRPLPTPIRLVATWAAILPVALLAQLALAPLVGSWPAPLATTAVLTLAVPVAALWTVPLAMRIAMRLGAGAQTATPSGGHDRESRA